MQKNYCFENAINIIKKGITSLSLLILLSVTVYSNPIDKNTDQKTGYNFLTERPSFTFWPNPKGGGSYSTTDCTYRLLASNIIVTLEEGFGVVTVRAGAACAWRAAKNADWITFTTGQSGTGDGSVGYSYTANTEWATRTGTIAIAGQTFTITQEGRPLVADNYEPNNTVEEVAQASTFTPTFTENASTLSISPATCHNSTDIDIFKINLEAGYSYLLSGALYNAYNQIDNSNYTLYAKISYSTNGSTWINWGDSQLSNNTVQGETFYLKIEPYSGRVGTYAARIDINRIVDCNPGLLLASSEVSAEAGNGQVTVTTNPLCTSHSPWTATVTSGAYWITLTSGLSATGNSTVGYSYTANTAWSSRTGTITIARQTYTVTQLPPPLTLDSYEGSTGNNTAEQAHTFPQPVFNNENASTISILEANCHNVADVDIYKIILETEYSYTISGALYDQYNQTAGSSYTLNVKGFYSTNGSNWIDWGDSQLPGKTVQGGTLYLKIEPYNRGNTGTYAARIDIKKAATAGCTYTLLPTSREATTETDNGQINVTTGPSCFRTATSNANWITLTSGQSATGLGSVAYTYQANRATESRTGTITIADQTFTITQEGRPLVADSYEPNNTVEESQTKSITPAFTENAGSVSISPATCHNSTDIDVFKIILEAGYSSYTLSGALYNAYNQIENSNYTLYAKISYSTNGFTWIYWGNRELSNKTMQGGTLYLKIEPNSSGDMGTYAAKIDINRIVDCNPGLLLTSSEVSVEAGNGQVTVTTSPSCTSHSPWTATSNANWITLTSGQSAAGSGSVTYTYKANRATLQRSGTITVAGQTFTITQAGHPLVADSYEPNNTVEESQATSITPAFTENAGSVSISPATCHNSSDIDIFKINLEAGYSYTLSGVLYGLFNQIDNSNYTLSGKASYSANGSTWIYWGNRQLSNKTIQGETLYLKIEPNASWSTGTYAARIDINRTVDCNPGLLLASSEVSAEAGNGQVTVTKSPSCTSPSPWTATSNANWITLTSGLSATGSGNVAYTYKANRATLQRTGTITIAGQTFTITQAGCPLVLDNYEPNNTVEEVAQASRFTPTFTENASTLSISPATCHNSTDIDIYKINLEAGYSYTLSGVLYDTDNNQANNTNYTLDVKSFYSTDGANWLSWGDSQLPNKPVQGETFYLKIEPYGGRVGTYAANIDINRTVDCNSGLLLASSEVSAEAGNGQVTVTTSPLCTSPSPWTATVTSGANWITLTSGLSGTGNSTVGYSYTANTAWSSRTGTITIAGQTYTVTQLPPPLTPDSYEENNTAEQAHSLPEPVFNNENASTISVSEANCHNVADVDYYKINLEAGYIYTISGALHDRVNQTAGSSYTLDVKGSYSTNGTHWIDWGDSQLPGKTVQGGTHYYLKIEPNYWGNVGTYAAKIDIKKTATAGCTYTLLPTSREATPETDSGLINVTTDPSCLQTATSNANWITLTSGQSTTGSGSVGYTYKANRATESRTGTITIAGQTFTITQAGLPLVADSYEPNNTVEEIAQASRFTPTFTENASTLSISPATCHNSTDIDIYKINLEAGYSYTLSGALYNVYNQIDNSNYTLYAKISYSTSGSTWINWGDSQLSNKTVQGETFYLKIESNSSGGMGTYAAKIDINRTVDCNPGLLLASSEVSAEVGNGQVTVTTNPLCTSPSPWTATVTSGANWITLTSGLSGTGNGTVGYFYTANTTWSSRTGTITIADQTYTVTQLPPPLTPDSYEGNNTAEQAHSLPEPVFNNENASTISILEANCHNVADVDYYKINLEAGYIYTISGALHDRVNQTAGSSYTLNVKGFYSTNGTHWIDWGDSQLPGKTVQGGTHYLKIEPHYRGNLGTYAARIDIKKTTTAGCTYTLLPTSREATPETDSGLINVTTDPSCLRTATSNANWITLTSGQSATGPGSVAYTYKANRATLQRSGTITIADQTFTINQAGRPLVADSYEPNNTVEESQAKSTTPTFTENASRLSISPATCHNSTDIDIYKINLEAGYSYTLSGVLYDTDNNQANNTNYTLDVKSFYSTDGSNWLYWGDSQLPNKTVQGETFYLKIEPYNGRVGTYAAKIDINRIVDCNPDLLLLSNEVSPEAGNGQVTVTTNPSCTSPSPWTATVTSGANWITLTSGQSATGSGSVAYTYTANIATESRTGTIAIAGQTFTITQAGLSLVADSYEPNNTVEEVAQASTFTPTFIKNASRLSISPATCHNSTDIDIYKINLEAGYSYTLGGALYDMDNNQANNTNYTLDIKSSYSTDGTTWNEWGDTQLSRPTVQGETLYIKIIPHTSGNTGTYAAKIDINRTVNCRPRFLPASKEAASEAGDDQITVTAEESCTWEATTSADWITLTSVLSGTGSVRVVYFYTENTAPSSRTGTITIAGQPFIITQEGLPLSSDRYEPNNTAAEVSQAATFIPVFTQKESRISISPANCHHADDVDIYKINLETGYSYAVSGVLYDRSNQINNSNYSLDARISYSTDKDNWSTEEHQLPNTRVQGGIIYLKIKPFYNKNQVGTYAAKIDIIITGGCTYKLSATSREATLAAGTDKIEITAGSLCDWTATSNADWITITSGQSGKGLGSVWYSYTENKTADSRTGTITVADQTFTVNQSVVTGIETTGNVKIFPNPARDFVTIDFSGTTIKCATVKIANQLGQMLYVQDSPNQTLQIPLKEFTGGVYFIFLQGEGKTWVQKLVIK